MPHASSSVPHVLMRKAAPIDVFVCDACADYLVEPRVAQKPERHLCGERLRQLRVERFRCPACGFTTEGVTVARRLFPLRRHPDTCPAPSLRPTRDPVMEPVDRRAIEAARLRREIVAAVPELRRRSKSIIQAPPVVRASEMFGWAGK